MRGKNRPADERARAVGIAVVTSGAEAARQTGIPERTIQQWVDSPEFAELRVRTKEQVAEEWWSAVQTILRSIVRDIDKAPVRDRSIAFGVISDKLAMLRGDATDRYESRDLTKAFDDHELAAIRRVVERATAPDSEEAAVVGAGERGPAPA